MATERQIEANRKNAKKSTGPKSTEGKARSRGNALTHGMTGQGIVLDEANQAAIAERMDAWSEGYDLRTVEQEDLLRMMVVASLQHDRAHASADIHQEEFAVRATHAWDEDRRIEAESIAARLAKEPALTLRRLEATSQGADILLDRWDRLAAANDANGDWNEAERGHALDLLGLPTDLRSGRTPLDVSHRCDPIEFRRAFVKERMDRLRQRKADSLDGLDAMHRHHAEATYGAELSKTGQLIHRYQKEAFNRLWKARVELRAAEKPRDQQDADRSASLERQVKRMLQRRAAESPGRGEEVATTAEVARPERRADVAHMPERGPGDTTLPSRPSGTNGTTFLAISATPARHLNRRERRAAKSLARRG
jgi:hypothetical protein